MKNLFIKIVFFILIIHSTQTNAGTNEEDYEDVLAIAASYQTKVLELLNLPKNEQAQKINTPKSMELIGYVGYFFHSAWLILPEKTDSLTKSWFYYNLLFHYFSEYTVPLDLLIDAAEVNLACANIAEESKKQEYMQLHALYKKIADARKNEEEHPGIVNILSIVTAGEAHLEYALVCQDNRTVKHLEKAVKHLNSAYKIFKQENQVDYNFLCILGLAHVKLYHYYTLSASHSLEERRKLLLTGLKHYRKALPHIQDPQKIIHLYQIIGDCYLSLWTISKTHNRLGSVEAARKHYQMAIKKLLVLSPNIQNKPKKLFPSRLGLFSGTEGNLFMGAAKTAYILCNRINNNTRSLELTKEAYDYYRSAINQLTTDIIDKSALLDAGEVAHTLFCSAQTPAKRKEYFDAAILFFESLLDIDYTIKPLTCIYVADLFYEKWQQNKDVSYLKKAYKATTQSFQGLKKIGKSENDPSLKSLWKLTAELNYAMAIHVENKLEYLQKADMFCQKTLQLDAKDNQMKTLKPLIQNALDKKLVDIPYREDEEQ